MKQQNCTNTMSIPQPIRWVEVTDILNRIPTTGMAVLVSAFNKLCHWQQRAETRQRMINLDEHMLKDVGLSRAQANAEAGKPFWL